MLCNKYDADCVPCFIQEESKPSPLTLLAQTCNSIGRESTTASTSSSAAKSKSADDAKNSRPLDTLSDASRHSTSRDQPHTDADSKDAVTAATRLTSSPVDVAVSSSPSTTTAVTARSLPTDLGRRHGRTQSPAKASPSPSLPGPASSPSQRQGADGKSPAEYAGVTASVHAGCSDPDGLYAMQYLAAVAALQRQSAAVDAGLLPYLAAQRLPVHPLVSASDRCAAGGPLSPVAGRLKPGSCSDPCCSRCLQLSAVAAAVATSSRGAGCAGCSQCGTHAQSSTTTSSTVLQPGGHGAFAAALSALCRLPPPPPTVPGTESSVVGPSSTSTVPSVHTCNWFHPGGAYCGQRFSSVDELMQHLHSHCGSTADHSHTVPFAPDLHPVATGSLFAPLAVLYGASSSYSPLDFMPPALPPPPPSGQVQLPSTTVSPSSLLRHHHQHSLAVAAAAASRYHPYRVPPTLLPPSAASAAYPPSLAAYYGALCGIAPGSNGTVPAVRL